MPTKSNPIERFNQVLLFIVLVFVILYFAKSFLIPIAIGGMMAMLLVPVCKRLERHKIPRGLSAVICVILTLVLMLAGGYFVFRQLVELGKDLPMIGRKLNGMLNSG